MVKENCEQLSFEVKAMETDRYVYKSHNLIESGYNLTLNEQRLTYLASKKLKPRYIKSNIKTSQLKTYLAHETFKDIKIYVNEFKNEFNISSNNLYTVLQDTSKSLLKKDIKYLQDDGTFVEKNWVITSKYNPIEKFVSLTFHPDLILDLLVFKGRFGKLEYESSKTFGSSYTFRIYELLQNYAYKGTREFEIEDFRYKIGIYDDAKYSKYGELKRNVINPSIKAINERTNLNITLKEIRTGRKVGRLHFTIEVNEYCEVITDTCDSTIDSSQVAKMKELLGCDLTAGQVGEITDIALEAIKAHKIDMSFYDYIKYEVDVVKQYAKRKEVTNYIGTIKAALKNYWTENISLPKSNTFNNFEAREYDYEKLENQLLGWEDPDLNDIYAK